VVAKARDGLSLIGCGNYKGHGTPLLFAEAQTSPAAVWILKARPAIELETAKEATEKAVDLLGCGMSGVAITDLIGGRTYRSGEFQLLLNEKGKFNA
jgi:hypothetical protein